VIALGSCGFEQTAPRATLGDIGAASNTWRHRRRATLGDIGTTKQGNQGEGTMQPAPRFDTLGLGLDTEQLRLVLADLRAGHQALIDELTQRLKASELTRDLLRAELDRLKAEQLESQIARAIAEDHDLRTFREKEAAAKEAEQATLRQRSTELQSQNTTLLNEKSALAKKVAQQEQWIKALERAIRESPWLGKAQMPAPVKEPKDPQPLTA
jgi:hypothetical protein